MSILFSNIMRYLRIALKYRFELLIDAAYMVAMMIAFGFLGVVVKSDAQFMPYSFQKFILVGIFFWTFMEKGYVEATRVIPEEARLGTLGTLMNNNVSPLSLIVGEMAAWSILNSMIVLALFVPVFFYLGLAEISALGVGYAVIMLILSWLYILAVAILMGSLALMFKKIGAAAGVLLQALKVGSGFFFPVAAFSAFPWPISVLTGVLRIIPVTRGLEVSREILIQGKLPMAEGSLLSAFGVSFEPIISMAGGVVLGFIVSIHFYRLVERKAMRLGMIEHY